MDPRFGLPSSPRPSNTPTLTRPVPPTPPTCPPPLPPRSPAQQLAPPAPASPASATTPTFPDFSSSNLSALPPPAPPLPPRLSLTTSFPEPAPPLASASAQTDALAPRPDELQGDPELPTYAHLQSQEVGNPRFGRWKGWIEKRARERKDEREALREAGVQESSGWNLPDGEGEGGDRRSSAELSFEDSALSFEDSETRARDARAEQRLSRQANNQRSSGMVGVTVTNPDPPSSNPSFVAAAASAKRELKSPAMSPSSSLLGKGRVHELTKSMGIHPLGGRFARGVEGRVRTGCILPSGSGVGGNAGGDRFMLIGTDEGLTLLDLNPTLSHTIPLRTSAAPSLSEASLHPLWTGLDVLQLEVILETSTPGSSGGPVGLVVGLVKPEGGEAELRMWSLAALSNLARWRVFNESSPPLDLSAPFSATNASPTTSTEGKRSSRSYIKSLFSSSSPTSPTDTKGKGKARASGSVAVSTPLRESRDEDGGFVVLGTETQDGEGHCRFGSSASSTTGAEAAPTTADSETRFFGLSSQPTARLSSESLRPSSISSSFGRTTPTPISPSNANLSLPLEWASSSLRFPLPKGAGPILFFTLCRTPPSGTEEHPRRERGIRERRKEMERKERGRVWLMVATARTVYLYESREGGKRRWSLRREFYAPATPIKLSLIRALPPHGPQSPPPLLGRRDSRKGKRSSSPPTSNEADDLPTDLALFLTMRTKAVLINLVDSSVREVALPPTSSPSGSAPTRSVSTLQTASSLTARAMEVGKSKVSALVEGKQGIPVGMRGEGGKGLVKGKKVGVDGAVMSGGEAGGGGDWVGCQMLSLVLPGGGAGRKDVLLLTKGSTSYVYPSPLPYFTPSLAASSSTSSASTSNSFNAPTPPTTLPTPLATFSFPLTSSSPLVGLTPLIRHDLEPQYREKGLQHLVLTTWTRSGVHVKEGIVDPLGAQRGGAGGKWFTPLDEFEKRVGESLLLSSTASSATDQPGGQNGAEKDEQEELEGQASLDFGREVLQLGVGGSTLSLPLSTHSSTTRAPAGDSDSDDDDESEFGAERRARSEKEKELKRATEGGVFFCVRGVEDWGLKWVG